MTVNRNRRTTVLLGVAFAAVLALALAVPQENKKHKPAAGEAKAAEGREMFLRFCASCHGKDGKGEGPAAVAMKTRPSDLTSISRRHGGKYPTGYVGALLKFGRNLASHGSEEMPVWGSRFKTLDPVGDPTGQKHVDSVVAYIESLQVK